MIEVKKIDDITVEVTYDNGEKKVWTIETLEHGIAQFDFELDNITAHKNESISIKNKALELGVIHPKDVIPETPEVPESEEVTDVEE